MLTQMAAEEKSQNPSPKKRARKPTDRTKQAILPAAIYTRPEAAKAIGCSQITLIRAFDKDHLKGYRVGRHVRHSGQHLLDWLESGGKTA